MQETSERGSLKPILRALCQSDVAIALLFFILALASRWYFAATHPNYNGLVTVRGVPYSDGQTWTFAAIELLHGHGLGNVYRPFFSIVLALFFIWTDWSFTVITVVNVLAGAITAAFLFLAVRLSFNRCIGLAAAAFFAFDPSQVIKGPEAATEPLGLLFFVLSVYFMLEISQRRTGSAAVLSGVFLGLSNLTRPLTLFCAPVYVALLGGFEWSRRKSLRPAIIIVSLFTLGTIGSMAPWLIRQKIVHGVWSVSTNMGEALYAATSPQYKTWTQQVRRDADRAGVKPTVGTLYAFYMHGSVEHIRENAGFYFRQTSAALWDYLNCFDLDHRTKSKEFAFRTHLTNNVEAQILFIFGVGAMLLFVGLRKIKNDLAAGAIFLFVSVVLMLLWRLLPSYGNFLILSAGFVLGLLWGKSKENVLLLAASLLITGVGGAIFNNPALYRTVLMTDWLFASFYLAAFFYAASSLTSGILRVLRKSKLEADNLEVTPSVCSFAIAFESRVKSATKILTVLLLLFAGVSATRLAFANLGKVEKPAVVRGLSPGQKAKILLKLKLLSSVLDERLPSPSAVQFFVPPARLVEGKRVKAESNAKPLLGVQTGIVPYFIHYFPEGTDFASRSHVFKRRPFAYSMFRLGRVDIIFPGRIPRQMSGHAVIVIGKVDPRRMSSVYPFAELQGEAIVPLVGGESKKPDFAHLIISSATP
jgi:Dolichyl-phosphate-mannose-protein mannosyltransferase